MDQLDNIQNCIFEFRGQRVMIDRDLADLYGVPTKVLNQAVKRNMRRFPEDFMFQLNDEEKQELVTFCDRLGVLKHSGVNPKAFTQEGVAMLSGILNSEVAIETNIAIMRAFVSARKLIASMSVSHQIKKLSTDIEFIKSEMEDTLEIQNDINESTRAQLDAISTALAELQAKPADVPPICQLWHNEWLVIRKTLINSEHIGKLKREGSHTGIEYYTVVKRRLHNVTHAPLVTQ